jgi:hypothetical protein
MLGEWVKCARQVESLSKLGIDGQQLFGRLVRERQMGYSGRWTLTAGYSSIGGLQLAPQNFAPCRLEVCREQPARPKPTYRFHSGTKQ